MICLTCTNYKCFFTGNDRVWGCDYYHEHECEIVNRFQELHDSMEQCDLKEQMRKILDMDDCNCPDEEAECACPKRESCPCKRNQSYKCGGCY